LYKISFSDLLHALLKYVQTSSGLLVMFTLYVHLCSRTA